MARTLEQLEPLLTQAGHNPDHGFVFSLRRVEGPLAVLQVDVRDLDTVPLFVSVSGGQLLCIAQLFADADVIPERRTQMLEKMLEWSIPMPLSSYGKLGDVYVVFGALTVDAAVDEIVLELRNLSENAMEARKVMQEFLRKPNYEGF